MNYELNYRVRKIAKTKFIHMKNSYVFYRFADLVSLIKFHNFGNKAEGKYSSVLKRTRSSLYDFVLFGSGKELNISWRKLEGFYKSTYA